MVQETMGAFTIEVEQGGDAKLELVPSTLTWWSWSVTRKRETGVDTIAEGVSWRSAREALVCARACALAMLEGKELFQRAVKRLGAKLEQSDGNHWTWTQGEHRYRATEAGLYALGSILRCEVKSLFNDMVETWVKEHAKKA